MVSVGSKALASRRDRNFCNLVEDNLMGREDKSYNLGRKKKGMSRKAKNGSFGFDADNSNKSVSGRATDGTAKPKKSSKYQNTFSEPQPSIVRYGTFCFTFVLFFFGNLFSFLMFFFCFFTVIRLYLSSGICL